MSFTDGKPHCCLDVIRCPRCSSLVEYEPTDTTSARYVCGPCWRELWRRAAEKVKP